MRLLGSGSRFRYNGCCMELDVGTMLLCFGARAGCYVLPLPDESPLQAAKT